MKTGDVSDTELSDAMQSLVRAIPAFFASDEQMAGVYYATYQERVEAVTKDDVAKAARERLHPDQMAIVVVGPESAIVPKIKAAKAAAEAGR